MLTNSIQGKLFDKKFVALTLRDVRRCEKCKRGYDAKYRVSGDNKPNSSRPVLLSCGHNICENCVYLNRHSLQCAVCQIPVEFEHTRWLKKSYDLNFCLLGQLANAVSFLSSEPTNNIVSNAMLAEETFIQKCSECEQAPANGICMNCKVDFCKRCFTSVHQNSKVLKKHRLTQFEMQTLQLRIPKEKFCKTHKRLCDKFCYDCNKTFCLQCIRLTHGTHHVAPLSVENENHKDKIISFLETMKETRENIRKAQKDVRICENRLEDFATSVTLEINDYFLDLHNFLQLEERRILEEFKVLARSSQKSIHEACAKLSDGQITLNNIRSSMEGFLHKPPHNVHINAVIEMATTQLEQLPCQIQISEVAKNPFVFKKLKDMRKEISKSYNVIGIDPKIHIRITPLYGDQAFSFEVSSEGIASPEESMSQMKSVMDTPRMMSVSSSSTVAIGKVKRDGRITNIISPFQFYVQDLDAISNIVKQMSKTDDNISHVELVEIGEMYAVYQAGHKLWLRGIMKEEMKKTKTSKTAENLKYKVFLIDYGTHDEIPKKHFRLMPEQVRSVPAAAVACKLVDIAPADIEWSEEAHNLMVEIIQNKPVQVSIHDTTKSPWSVDVVTLNYGEPISIREALIYTGLGIDNSVTSSQKNSIFAGTKPTQLSKMKQRLSRQILSPGEIFRVNVTHIENPQQFFVIKFAQSEELTKLESEMDLEYSGKLVNTIYYAQLQMCCAILVDEKWYRGCIEEISGPNNIRVRLVDNGRSVTLNWRQLRVLKERFTTAREISIECSLADIQPLQENNYEWTETAIAEFIRMTSNPNIQMTISKGNQFRYQVILNVLKKHLDVNIGAMLVKFKHALSTGEGSAIVENIRGNNNSPLDPLLMPAKDQVKKISKCGNLTNAALRTLKRTPIQVVHIVNPGEFYIHLVEHIPGILKFQEELQITRETSLESETSIGNIEWNVNDNCLVLTSLNESASKQWYRGIIKSINTDEVQSRYNVYLRDRGLVVQNLKKNKLAPISDVFKRVANAAILCHLACVHPTGGMKKWSHSAIDQFVHNVHSFESVGATIQGTTKNSSIPVVLWGTLTETNDPLGPCTPKYTNINKILVCTGLAHLTEKIDITRQMDEFVQTEIEQGQQSLQDWYTNFKKALEDIPITMDESEDNEETQSHFSNLDDISEIIEDPELATEWLPAEPITKTIFTAYPTYIDDEAIVYMHDAEKHSLLAKMRFKINQIVDLKPVVVPPEDEKWVVGQPCLARYHLDRFLYRAVIQRILPNKKYEVQFIDYGNIECCDVRDLLKMTAFPKIPVQAVRFIIDGIEPRGGTKLFTTVVLDLIHGVIVDKLCAIRVAVGEEHNDIKKCSIRFDRTDLATYLIQNGFANGVGIKKLGKKATQLEPLPIEMPEVQLNDNSNSEDELREFMKHQICDPIGDSPPNTIEKKKTTAMFHPEEYKRMFEQMQTEKLYKSIAEGDSEMFAALETSSESDANEDDVVELEFSFRSNYWHVDENTESAPPPAPQSEVGSNFDNFDPGDTSSLLSNFSGIEAFKPPQLPTSVKSFYCEVAYARSPTILHIFPHLSELEYRQLELARRIKLMISKIPPVEKFETKTPCLARYSKDKHWYRAIIRSHNASMHLVKVFYVDFLNSELIKEEHVRKCPKELLAWPLRTFEMKIHGLKSNPRLREKDVKQAIKKCLGGRKLYARIIAERDKIPQITLYKSESEKEVPVYFDLIDQKFLCKE